MSIKKFEKLENNYYYSFKHNIDEENNENQIFVNLINNINSNIRFENAELIYCYYELYNNFLKCKQDIVQGIENNYKLEYNLFKSHILNCY